MEIKENEPKCELTKGGIAKIIATISKPQGAAEENSPQQFIFQIIELKEDRISAPPTLMIL